MSNVMPFRPFKLTNVVESGFISGGSTANRSFAEEDLARSGLTMEDIGAVAPAGLRLTEKAQAGYTIPYFGLDGQPIVDERGGLIMYRVRLKIPEFSRDSRYTQPPKEQLQKYNLPSVLPYFTPSSFNLGDGAHIVCCEGEKKTVSVMKFLGLPAFGIGGCEMWRNPDGSLTLHPWIVSFLKARGTKKLTIIPDGDVLRYHICNAYGTFLHAARQIEGLEVELLHPSDKIDDLLLRWGVEALDRFGEIGRVDDDQLVQSIGSLSNEYNLSYKLDSKGGKVVHQHSSNITRLLESHPAFPRMWVNTDTNQLMMGDKLFIADQSEMEVTNFFQHNLNFHAVKTHQVRECVVALGKRQSKSPFLEYVSSQVWDGVARLRTWLTDYWGVPDEPYIREVAIKWLVAACARLAKPGTKVDWMLITVGGQGVGKTSMPSLFFRENSRVIVGDQSDTDFFLKLNGSLCNVVDEMDSFSKRDSSFYKATVTVCVDNIRPPYGRAHVDYPRRFTLYGCGNKKKILQRDPSGQRRWVVVDVGDVLLDFKGLEAVVDQLWAEAWHVYTGEQLPFWEVFGTSERSRQYEQDSPMQTAVDSFIAMLEMDKHSVNGVAYFELGAVFAHMEMKRSGPNSATTNELKDLLIEADCIEPEGRANTRHPGTGATGRWWKYEFRKS